MTCKLTGKTRVLTVIVQFFAVLTVLMALAALAQSVGAVQPSGKASALPASLSVRSPLLAQNHPPLQGTNNAESVTVSRRSKKHVARAPDLQNPLFLQAVTYGSGGTDAFSIAVGDVNHDRKLDLIVAAFTNLVFEDGPAGVLLGNGDGTFQLAVTYDSGGQGSSSVALADVNGDGKLDLIVADSDSDTVGVMLGNGDGTFQQASVYGSGGAFPGSAVVGDVNADGKPDLIVANCGTNTCEDGLIGVLLGNGDGTFQPVVTYSSGGLWATSVAVADVNEDGKLDLLVANFASGTVGVLLGKGDGTFLPAVTYSLGDCGRVSSVAVADVNGDRRPDLVITGPCISGDVVGVLLGNGDGTFQPAATYNTGGTNPSAVAVGDVDGDGKPDLVVANFDSHTVGLLLGNGDGTFQPALTYGAGARSVAIADVNRDHRPDILAAGNGAVSVLLNNTGPHVPTTTTLVSSENPVQPEFTITYTATVTSKKGKPLTGTVSFQDGGNTVATVTLTANQAVYSALYTKVGSHDITATYSGDLHNSVSKSAILTEYIEPIPIPTKTVLNTSGSPSLVGQPVTFTATVTWSHGTVPDGELVTFYGGTTKLASVPLVGGIAAYSTSSLTAGTHRIKAVYAGEIRFRVSSGAVTQVVDKYTTTTTTPVSSLNPSTYGQAVTWSVTVSSTGPNPPTGKVHFVGIGLATLSGGVATLTRSWLNAGTHAITAEYQGDSTSAPSTSSVLDQVVNPASTKTAITSSANPSSSGQALHLRQR